MSGILVDTNIILDIVLEREPFVAQAVQLLQKTQDSGVDIFLSATTITDLYYIVRKAKGKDIALNFLKNLLAFVEIAAVDKEVILQALESDFSDFEDAVQENSAKHENIDILITRNKADFEKSTLQVYTPEAYLNQL